MAAAWLAQWLNNTAPKELEEARVSVQVVRLPPGHETWVQNWDRAAVCPSWILHPSLKGEKLLKHPELCILGHDEASLLHGAGGR